MEENEKTKDSRLAREFVVALPIELSLEQWQTLLTDFVQNQFVADGCAPIWQSTILIHRAHNRLPHIRRRARLMKTCKWQYKTEKEYLCSRDGEENGALPLPSLRLHRLTDGRNITSTKKEGRKKVYMTPSAAEEHGYERASKYPKSTKYGRQNPISERWNSEEQLLIWRKTWADVTNKYLERYGHEERIDHRSFVERGIDEQPTIHEGVIARALEQKGIVSDRCELNRQIKADKQAPAGTEGAVQENYGGGEEHAARYCRSVGKAAGKYADLLLSVRAYPQQQETDDRCLEYSGSQIWHSTAPLCSR
ncbi:MobA/MobL family protein [Faecalibacterium taiwanense]|uniref:MobA/MobL family protein n=1 Tax=Faecalibacterium taiwanense TaxID=3030638 RepID=UPI003AB0BF2A